MFETYPPSSVLVAVVALALILLAGLGVVLPFLIGVGLMALGQRLDLYGVRERR